MSDAIKLENKRHEDLLAEMLELAQDHTRRCKRRLEKDPEALLTPNDRQMMQTGVAFSKELNKVRQENLEDGLVLPTDKRYAEIGQAICIGDLEGALQRIYSMQKDPPKGIDRYWFRNFKKDYPLIRDRDGTLSRFDEYASDHRSPIPPDFVYPMKSRIITPMPDMDVEIPPCPHGIKDPMEYGVGTCQCPASATTFCIERTMHSGATIAPSGIFQSTTLSTRFALVRSWELSLMPTTQ